MEGYLMKNLRTALTALILTLTAVVAGAANSQQDPCTAGSNAAIDGARDYLKIARSVPRVCSDVSGDCYSAEANAEAALLELTNIHQVMINACGSVVPPPPPAEPPTLFGDLVINEVMANPAIVLELDGEWIEILNPTETNFDLNGLTVRVITGSVNEFVISTTLVVPAGGFVVLGKTTDLNLNGGIQVDYTANFVLPNGGFSLEIANGTTLVDSVSFAVLPGAGASYQLDPDFANATDNDEVLNWCPAAVFYGANRGTPGAPNHSCMQ